MKVRWMVILLLLIFNIIYSIGLLIGKNVIIHHVVAVSLGAVAVLMIISIFNYGKEGR